MPQVQTRNASSKAPRLELTSVAFRDGENIPAKYTADGENVSPPIRWREAPAGTRSFALVCEDPDAPSGLFVHWLAWNIEPDGRELEEAIPPSAQVDGIRQGRNGFGGAGYGGPKPPPGKAHRYRFRLFALDNRPELAPGASRVALDRAIDGHVLGEGVLVGKYER
jgi:Raf kinase inhibitor-like YbhB/YbcL family protein